MVTDDILYRRYLGGDEDSLSALMERHGDKLTLYLDGCLHDLHESKDLMIEAFAYLIAKKPRIRDGGKGTQFAEIPIKLIESMGDLIRLSDAYLPQQSRKNRSSGYARRMSVRSSAVKSPIEESRAEQSGISCCALSIRLRISISAFTSG